MPGMGGLEVLERVKRAHPELEVIVLTGWGSDEDEVEARRLGAFDYVRKPIELTDLIDIVRRAGRARRDAAGGP
jgi:DNA-binding NtrC family response regulator